MSPADLRVGSEYVRASSLFIRKIFAIDAGIVTYAIEGIFTLRPLRMQVEQFAAWAERERTPAA